MGGTGWDEASRTVEFQRSRGVGCGAWGDLRGGVSKYFINKYVCRKKHLRIPLRQYVILILDQMLIKWISQFSNTGWRTDNCFAGFHLACSRLAVVGGERGKKWGHSLGSWGRAK